MGCPSYLKLHWRPDDLKVTEIKSCRNFELSDALCLFQFEEAVLPKTRLATSESYF